MVKKGKVGMMTMLHLIENINRDRNYYFLKLPNGNSGVDKYNN